MRTRGSGWKTTVHAGPSLGMVMLARNRGASLGSRGPRRARSRNRNPPPPRALNGKQRPVTVEATRSSF
jgi:hypothetical protein